ncbi:thiolase family protein [Paraburkholderia caribensis]|uniref:hypothetical protein n=1 Tax=Paraburkholderia caribensis TaxID=75105 RepID=UPI001F3ECF61|nr:hypothetical protein [Paraburkholderia caribensis]
MGVGPGPASETLLARPGMSIDQMDVIELNEAFAAQGLATLRMLGVADDDPRVNPNGGAMALGHPLGASGARLVTTASYQLQHTGGRFALCYMRLRRLRRLENSRAHLIIFTTPSVQTRTTGYAATRAATAPSRQL